MTYMNQALTIIGRYSDGFTGGGGAHSPLALVRGGAEGCYFS